MPNPSPTAWCIVLACVLCLPHSPAWGSGAIHKCAGPDGQSSYQSTPCAPTQRTEWVRDYPVAPSPPAARATPAPAPRTAKGEGRPRAATRSTGRRQRAVQGAVISLHKDPAACARAKKSREQAYARLGLKRDFATSRKLDDRVNEACR